MIKFRKTGYSFMSWNMDKIKANLEGSYSKEQVMAAANVVAAAASSGMGALFRPGTDKEAAGQTSGVKPEFFKEQDKVKELAMVYSRRPMSCRRWLRAVMPLPSSCSSAGTARAARPATTSTARIDRSPHRAGAANVVGGGGVAPGGHSSLLVYQPAAAVGVTGVAVGIQSPEPA